MLSKSAARRFFLLGTVACSAAFVLLTIDTIKQVPKRTNEAALTEEVIRGKDLWDTSNCMGCHTLMGEGGYYAPELTKVFERRGEGYIKAILKDPEKMFPGERKMVNYHFNDREIADLVAFFKWIGNTDLNGFPPKPTGLGAASQAAAPATSGTVSEAALHAAQPAFFTQTCTACHSVAGKGGNVGPALDGIADRRDAAFLEKWLKDPTSIKADSKMPNLGLAPEQVHELVTYLSTLKGEVTK